MTEVRSHDIGILEEYSIGYLAFIIPDDILGVKVFMNLVEIMIKRAGLPRTPVSLFELSERSILIAGPFRNQYGSV